MNLEEMKLLPEDKQKEIYDRVTAARKKGKTCLPVDSTEVLTQRGWLAGGDVVVGDYVMSLNTVIGRSEWCAVTDTMLFKNQPTILMQNNNFKLESTKDHRWFVEHITGRGKTRRVERKFSTTGELSKAMNIITAAEYVGGGSDVTPAQAAVIGWMLADGYLKVSDFVGSPSQGINGAKCSVNMSIAQGKFYEEVKADLHNAGLVYKEYKNNSGVPVFQIRNGDSRKFLLSVGLPLKSKHEVDYEGWLTSLSYDALEAFYDAFWKADGNTAASGTTYATKVIYQNSGKIADSVQLCSVLLGRTTLKSSGGYCTIRSQNRSTVTMQKVVKSEGRYVDVFCLTTKNSTFLIRQNGFVTFTGNCNYASVYNAGPAAIARAAGVTLAEGKVLHEAYWKLNWAVKAIADEQVVIRDSKGGKWLINPVNGFCYSLRSEADRFSTLAQGTGSYFFDMWVDNVLEQMQTRYKKKTLTGSFHDELILKLRDNPVIKDLFQAIVEEAVGKVNVDYNLRRELGCGVDFGQRYSDIH